MADYFRAIKTILRLTANREEGTNGIEFPCAKGDLLNRVRSFVHTRRLLRLTTLASDIGSDIFTYFCNALQY